MTPPLPYGTISKNPVTKPTVLLTDEYLKFPICEEFASVFELPLDYVYAEFVNPDEATLDEVVQTLEPFIIQKDLNDLNLR